MSARDITLELPGGVHIVVPDDLDVTTTYVLQEQGDWFEDEMRFVRAFARPGMRCIDAGANFGVYALTFAGAAGPAGRVWAVEPGAQALAYLARSIAANEFQNLEILPCALSRSDGRGFLGSADGPESRRLSGHDNGAAIEIRSLDSLAHERGISGVDFMKIDVEGEEANVLAGAAQFLAREIPLLMLEYRAEKALNEDVFAPLYKNRLDCYRLVPSLNLLVPFYESEDADEYQLNLFACGEARARQLSADGLLVTTAAQAGNTNQRSIETLNRLPYAQHCEKSWRAWAGNARGADADYAAALGGFLAATDAGLTPAARFEALDDAYVRLRKLTRTHFTPAHAASFIRVAQAYGRRAEAVTVCRRLAAGIASTGAEIFVQPFLPPWPHYDNVAPGDDPAGWLRTAVVESFEQLFQFSSYFKQQLAPEFLGLAVAPRFLSAAYTRRAAVFARRNASTR